MSLIDSIEGSELGDVGYFNTLLDHSSRTLRTLDNWPNLALIPLVRPSLSFSLKPKYQGEGNMSLIDNIEGTELGDVGHFNKEFFKKGYSS